ncbi:MAG: Lrp/AsnC family transcriptional regulator [Nanoarchaeota archaeon]
MAEKGVAYTEKYDLDTKDKLIIGALFENGRYSIADLSKKTGIRRDSALYRLKKLQKEKVILGFRPIVNCPSIGYPNIAVVLLRTQSRQTGDKKDFIDKIKHKPSIIHIATTLGRFDYYLVILYNQHDDLNRTLEEVRIAKPGYVLEYEMLQVVDEPKFDDILGLVLSSQTGGKVKERRKRGNQ